MTSPVGRAKGARGAVFPLERNVARVVSTRTDVGLSRSPSLSPALSRRRSVLTTAGESPKWPFGSIHWSCEFALDFVLALRA
jgi:hypothetical protein